jgi:hypothetical protein
MLISHTSATNCARLYHRSFSRHNIPPRSWPVGFTLTTEHVWDAFVIACLLDDHQKLGTQLIIPNSGMQKDRFMEALRARNLRIRLHSQPEFTHRCEKCCQNVKGRRVWVVVVDGVTVGHPCCAVHNCFVPLKRQRDRYCKMHEQGEGRQCAIKECLQLRNGDSLVCTDEEHVKAYEIYIQRGQARFQLKNQLERARVAHPNDAISEERSWDEVVDGEEEVDIELGEGTDESGEAGFNTAAAIQTEARERYTERRKLRAQFGRRRSHNEQIIVAPCGVILARQTFYGAEGVGSVGVRHVSFHLLSLLISIAR